MGSLSSKDLTAIQLIDSEADNVSLKRQLKKKCVEEYSYKHKVLQLNLQINELERRLKSQEVVNLEKEEDLLVQKRRDFLKSLAKKHKIQDKRWGYDPLTGELIIDNETETN